MWLHEQGARTCFFMLEGIARIELKCEHEKARKKHRFYKKMEDKLGQLDYWLSVKSELKNHKKLSAVQLNELDYKIEKAFNRINGYLIKNNFFERKLIKYRKPLLDLNNRNLIIQIRKIIAADLQKCLVFFESHKTGFNDLELQVHEFRRKLRWFSIYAQCLQGLITLQDEQKNYSWEKDYIDEETVQNPFNKLPAKKNLKLNIAYRKKPFLALSKIIQELGRIKDKGLHAEGLHILSAKSKPDKVSPDQHGELLKEAHQILEKFFLKDRVFAQLLVNPSKKA